MNLYKYFKETKLYTLFTGLIICLVYGPLVLSTGYHTDLEYIIADRGSMYNWSALDRFNLILLKKLTGLSWYNPFYEAFLFFITVFVLTFVMAWLISRLSVSIKPVAAYTASALFLIYPTFTEQYYFRFQCFEIAFGLFLLAVSGVCIHIFIKENKYWTIPVGIISAVLAFGIYQSMLNVMITFYIGMFTIMLFGEKAKTIGKGALVCTVHFISSCLLYKIICLIFCEKGGYFNDKIMWGNYPFSTCYHFVKHYIRNVLLGEKYVYTYVFAIVIVLSFVAFILLLIKEKAKALPKLAGLAGLIISPFILAILQGFEAEARTQLSLPLSIAFLWLFVYMVADKCIASKKFKLSWIATAIALVGIVINVIPCERLIYSYKMQADADRAYIDRLAIDLLAYDCKEGDVDALPVIIIGTLPYTPNSSCYEYNEENDLYILSSVFSLDAEVAPKYFFSTNRIIGAMNTAGYAIKAPVESAYMEEAYVLSEDMSCFPEDGYIRQTENYILVKLSDIDK